MTRPPVARPPGRRGFGEPRATIAAMTAIPPPTAVDSGRPAPDLAFVGKVRLLARVWAYAARAQVDLWRKPLPQAAATPAVRRRSRIPPTLLSRAVSRGLRIGPWEPRCLLRSLVLYRMLREQGDEADLIIALKARPASSDAHAWVELRGRDIGPLPGGRGYEELTRYPRIPSTADSAP